MKTTQYVKQEKAIAAADSGGIRARWLWGLRLLRDTDAMSSPKSLRHGVTEQLIAAAAANGLKLSEREIRCRLQCARTYPTEAQIGRAAAGFDTWRDLSDANFPAYDAPPDEPPADHRTDNERDHDRARALMDLVGEQGTLFPLSRFEPTTTTLKELADYAREQRELTGRFAERDRKRDAELERLIEAAGNDLSMMWQEPLKRLSEETTDRTDPVMV